jgi:CubicO group peptidase (beta-lactamase class C family)
LVSAHFADTRLHTRAFLVVKDGALVYERYGDGFGPSTPQLGWSMTKSITSTLLGMRHKEVGALGTGDPVRVDEWDDHKAAAAAAAVATSQATTATAVESTTGPPPSPVLTIGHALRMADGMDFDEAYEPGWSTTAMLFTEAAAVTGIMPVPVHRSPPGQCWQYSSLASNVLQRTLKGSFATVAEYLAYPEAALFGPIGIEGAAMETDPTNTFVGSSFSYMPARDWAKLGLLWLSDGVWPSPPTGTGAAAAPGNPSVAGTRLLPEGWMTFATTPTPTSNGVYGAQFWLGGNARMEEGSPEVAACDALFPRRAKAPGHGWKRDAFPRGTFLAHGFEDQMVAMVPSKGVILVRLGATKEVVIDWAEAKVALYRGVLAAIPDKTAA